MMLNKVYPSHIKPGATLGLVLPATAIDQSTLDKVLNKLDSLGFNYKLGQSMQRAVRNFTAIQTDEREQLLSSLSDEEAKNFHRYSASGFMSDSPVSRAADINSFFKDPEIDAIWCMRGGFSSIKLLPYLDFEIIRNNPKQFLGYSDITNLINVIYQKTGLVTYHAPMAAPNFIKPELLDGDEIDAYTWGYFDKFILNDWQEVVIKNPDHIPVETMHAGCAEGEVVGGNLSVLAGLVGTDYQIDTTDKIVFIEEVRNHIPFCDAALTRLRLAGFFDNIRGLIIGDFLNCHNRTGFDKCQDWTEVSLLNCHFSDDDFPILANVKLGHDKQTATMPIGAQIKLDTNAQSIVVMKK